MEKGPRNASTLEALRMVLSAFIGIRKKDSHEAVRVTPVQVIVIGIIAAACFVGGLVMVVRLVTG